MIKLQVPLSREEYSALLERAERDCRPTANQLRYLLRQALGLSSAENDNRPDTEQQPATEAR